MNLDVGQIVQTTAVAGATTHHADGIRVYFDAVDLLPPRQQGKQDVGSPTGADDEHPFPGPEIVREARSLTAQEKQPSKVAVEAEQVRTCGAVQVEVQPCVAGAVDQICARIGAPRSLHDTAGVLPRGQAPKHGLVRRLGQFVDIDVEQGGSHECQRHAGS